MKCIGCGDDTSKVQVLPGENRSVRICEPCYDGYWEEFNEAQEAAEYDYRG